MINWNLVEKLLWVRIKLKLYTKLNDYYLFKLNKNLWTHSLIKDENLKFKLPVNLSKSAIIVSKFTKDGLQLSLGVAIRVANRQKWFLRYWDLPWNLAIGTIYLCLTLWCRHIFLKFDATWSLPQEHHCFYVNAWWDSLWRCPFALWPW